MVCKLILFDMDGTLLNSHKQVQPSSLKALQRASEAGIICAFGTGRSISELSIYPEVIRYMHCGVCESGAMIYDFQAKQILHQDFLKEEHVRQIIEASRLEDLMVQFFHNGQAYMAAREIQHMEHYLVSVYQPLYEQVAVQTEDNREQALRFASQIEKINLFHASVDGRTRSRDRLRDLPLEQVDSEIANLELSPLGVSKGSGLRQLCSVLNIPVSCSAAVGDADNDLEMLKTAGLSIAMSNANKAAKAASQYVVADNDHDGIAQAVSIAMSYGC